MMMEENMDELFRKKLLNYEQEPPAYLLENILGSVAQGRRKKRLVWWRVAGVAAALLLAFIAGWQLNTNDSKEMGSVSSIDQKSNQKLLLRDKSSEKSEPLTTGVAQFDNSETNNSQTLAMNNARQYLANAVEHEIVSQSSGLDQNQEKAASESYSVLKPINGQLPVAEKDIIFHREVQRNENLISGEKTIDQQIVEMNKLTMAGSDKGKEKARWLFGAQVSPEFNGVRASQSQAYASNMIKTQSGSTDLSGGITVEYKKGKRWSLQSGVYYSGIGQTAGSKSLNSMYSAADGLNYFNPVMEVDAAANRFSMNSNAGVVVLDKIPDGMVLSAHLDEKNMLSSAVVVSHNEFIQDFDYVEVPLYLRYSVIDKKIGIDLLGGVSSNFLVGNRLYAEGSSGRTLVGKTKDMATFNYAGTLGLGLRYGLTNRLSFSIEPRFKYFLNSVSNNSDVTFKPYTIGVFTGFSYEF